MFNEGGESKTKEEVTTAELTTEEVKYDFSEAKKLKE